MKTLGLTVAAAAAIAIGWVGRSVFSDDAPKAPVADDWAEFSRPSEEHARLKALVGTWTVAGEMVMKSGAVLKSEGTSTFTMILGDRYLQREARGSFMGTPFEGRGIIGFDKGSKSWFSVWIDSAGTGLLVSEGVETEKGASWTFKGSFQGPSGPIEERDTLTISGPDAFTMTSYVGGSETPMMTLNATRKR